MAKKKRIRQSKEVSHCMLDRTYWILQKKLTGNLLSRIRNTRVLQSNS